MIYFFVECGGAKGYGNLLRCLPIHYHRKVNFKEVRSSKLL